jgi:hypothetical protein
VYTITNIMLYNQVELIVSHIHGDKINNSFDITNLQRYFFTQTLKKSFDSISNNISTTTIKRNTHDKVKRELQTVDIYKNTPTYTTTIPNNTYQPHLHQHQYKIQQRDTLFWSLYILHHGYLEYMKIQINYGNAYLNEKKKVYDNLHNKRDLVKTCNMKITNVAFQEIMSDLISYSNKNINYRMLYAFIAHYKYNIILLNKDKQSFFHFKNDMNGDTTHLIELRKGKYFNISNENMDETNINTIYANYIELHHYDKPMKGLSSYKVDDLKIISEKLQINHYKIKKDELYTQIYRTIAW